MTTETGTVPGRTIPEGTLSERAMLEGWLDFHRGTLLRKCAGLDDEELRRASVPPSELTLLGLVRHLTDVERHWFRRVFGGEDIPTLYYTDEDPDADFRVDGPGTAEETFAAWHREVALGRACAEGHALDTLGRPAHGGPGPSLRWIYTHMIEEYARHNGHADLLRERVDGTTGF
ncbi:DinB family protein [Streptomyces daliensis]